ncbi:hypothetical protein P7C73_g2253, partial [Tremellales sp. Uapishka_1]
MAGIDTRLGVMLEERRRKGRFRSLKEYDTSSSSKLVDFVSIISSYERGIKALIHWQSSNDYLSLVSSPSRRENFISRISSMSSIFGSTGSRLLSGSSPEHSALESRFSTFFDSPAALLFNSGWDANVSFFATVPQKSDWVVYDELVHASVHSGLRASRVDPARKVLFEHNSPDHLAVVLRQIKEVDPDPTVFLALESLYSMDGDFAPLPMLLDVLDSHVRREKQCVILDEAHSTGVYGENGRGIAHALGETGVEGRVGVRLMTFGKAVGCSGAVLLCSPTIRTFLINFARPLIFSTALPHSTLISLESAWDILQSAEGEQVTSTIALLPGQLPSFPSLPPPPPDPIIDPPSSPSFT